MSGLLARAPELRRAISERHSSPLTLSSQSEEAIWVRAAEGLLAVEEEDELFLRRTLSAVEGGFERRVKTDSPLAESSGLGGHVLKRDLHVFREYYSSQKLYSPVCPLIAM